MNKGWCPTLFAPMQSGDGFLSRLRPPGGVLTGADARLLADAAARHGNGIVELTNRAGLQFRGFSAISAAHFAAAMVEAGLAGFGRTVIAPPLAGDDPTAHPDATRIVQALEDLFTHDPRLAQLPPKFGVLVDAGGALPVGTAPADIRVTLRSPFPFVTLDGSNLAATGDPVDIVSRLAVAFLALSPARRVRDVPAEGIFVAAGLSFTHCPPPSPPRAAVGFLPYGNGRGAFLAGLPFGATDATKLAALAEMAKKFGDGTLRLTPFRAFAIPGVTDADTLRARLDALGLVVSPDDARARVAACPGAPACASAHAPTRADATFLAALNLPGRLHVSGCAKGCAHPIPADATLVAEPGGYALVRHGRAGGTPTHRGLNLQAAKILLERSPA
jgi:precorrin-3B synthase